MLSKVLAILALVALTMVVLVVGCGPKPTTEGPPQPPEVIDTTTPPPVEPPTPPPPEVKKLVDEDFKIAYFDFDKYNLRPDARSALEFDANILKENPDVTVMIEGHCDERGTVEYNLALGEKRARAAMDYLKSLGIDASRMDIISYGKERPVAFGHDEAAWQKNRRAKLTITSQ
jgi:peptidoglycan-associated lipoprotein